MSQQNTNDLLILSEGNAICEFLTPIYNSTTINLNPWIAISYSTRARMIRISKLNLISNLDFDLDLDKYICEIKNLSNNLSKQFCSICLNDFNEKNNQDNQDNKLNLICMLNCGHYFHKTCIIKWLVNKKNCPICRKICIKF